MKPDVVSKLNQLNQQFYATVATEFDDSRKFAWPGWEKLLPAITSLPDTQALNILDLGCGNGRFGLFLQTQLQRKFSYVGVDNNQQLLDTAANSISKTGSAHFSKADLLDVMAQSGSFSQFSTQPITIISLFGVLHHLPSFELRAAIVDHAWNTLPKGGLLLIATWQFMQFERFRQKVVAPSIVGLAADDLETNDYILDWQRGQAAYRYCHYTDDTELQQLITHHHHTWTTIDSFAADGKEGTVNHYLICKKTNRRSAG